MATTATLILFLGWPGHATFVPDIKGDVGNIGDSVQPVLLSLHGKLSWEIEYEISRVFQNENLDDLFHLLDEV